MLMAIVAGLGAFIGTNILLSIVYTIARGSSQLMNALLGYSYIGWAVKMVGWFAAAWVGMSVFDAMGGL